MSEQLESKILSHVKSDQYQPLKPRRLARELNLATEDHYHAFRDALRDLMHAGRIVLGAGGNVVLPAQNVPQEGIVGTYRHNRRGFGFVVPTDPGGHEDLYIGEGGNGGAITGDTVRAIIVNRRQEDGKAMFRGKIIEIIARSQKRFVGTLVRERGIWQVLPDGNVLTEPILTPDAAGRHIKPGLKVVVELTVYPGDGQSPQGVITEVLGAAGEKDVDLKSVIVQFNLPAEFPTECLDQARAAVDHFNDRAAKPEWLGRVDLSDHVICTIDPDDAKDYDDAISLEKVKDGWELGVHIADVSHFVETDSPLDEESKARGNSCYFPGFVIPMLPEILSNGVCSLQEGVPRLCKSAFIVIDDAGKPVRTRFANTVIRSANRLRYREAQAIIDGADSVPHPDGPRKISDYKPAVVQLLGDMDRLARRIQKRRLADGQLVLELPQIDLVLSDEGKVVGAEKEDTSFTHTLIEMFMVEANEAVARLLNSQHVPFLRRTHPDPDTDDSQRLRQFAHAAGHELPGVLDRKALQNLLAEVRGRPESFAINLAILKSMTRAEYFPKPIGHYALASEQYCHFTSPIRRYADLTIHRLLDVYITNTAGKPGKRSKSAIPLDDVPSFEDLEKLGKQISFTERRADDAERELRNMKVLDLLSHRIGEDFPGVVTGIANFGIFIQLTDWLIDGLIRYEQLMDDWWEVDEHRGFVKGQRTGRRISIGDTATVRVARVDPARRELDLSVIELHSRASAPVIAPIAGRNRGGDGQSKRQPGGPNRPGQSGQQSGPARRGQPGRPGTNHPGGSRRKRR